MLNPFLHEGPCRDLAGRGSQLPSTALCTLVTRSRGTACVVPTYGMGQTPPSPQVASWLGYAALAVGLWCGGLCTVSSVR